MIRGQIVNVADLQPHPMNYNQHPAAQVIQLRESLKQFGQVRDIIVWRQYVVAGHGVLLAAKAEKWAEISATRLPDNWGEERVIAYLAADNETARLSLTDEEQLAALLTAVSDDELKALAAGGEERLKALMGNSGEQPAGDAEPQTNHAEELREKWGVELGQMWRLPSRTAGQEHRLICGDCTDKTVVERVMGGEKAGGFVIDPPYGDGWVGPGWMTSSPKEKIENDKGIDFEKTMRGAFPLLYGALKNTALGWCFGHGGKKITYALGVASWADGFDLNNIATWDKDDLGMGQLLRNQWESILLLSKGKGIKGAWHGGAAVPNIFRQSGARPQSGNHPTPKPETLIRVLIGCVVAIGDICIDFFAGEGTTIIAAENLARQCRAVEISPAYVAVALQRYADAFGITPELAD